MHQHVGPGARQFQCDRPADAAGTAGDHRRLASEYFVHGFHSVLDKSVKISVIPSYHRNIAACSRLVALLRRQLPFRNASQSTTPDDRAMTMDALRTRLRSSPSRSAYGAAPLVSGSGDRRRVGLVAAPSDLRPVLHVQSLFGRRCSVCCSISLWYLACGGGLEKSASVGRRRACGWCCSCSSRSFGRSTTGTWAFTSGGFGSLVMPTNN